MDTPHIHVDGETRELVIRRGEAQDPAPLPKKVDIVGQIDAPRRFYETRRDQIDDHQAHVLVDRRGLSIYLQIDEKDENGTYVAGYLELNNELKAFKINADAEWSPADLGKFVKLRRAFFADREKHTAFVTSLEQFRAKIKAEIEEMDDQKGKQRSMIDRELETNVDLGFSLKIPIYEGQPDSVFKVDVVPDIRDRGCSFYLQSVELAELEKDLRDEIIDREIESFDCVVIDK